MFLILGSCNWAALLGALFVLLQGSSPTAPLTFWQDNSLLGEGRLSWSLWGVEQYPWCLPRRFQQLPRETRNISGHGHVPSGEGGQSHAPHLGLLVHSFKQSHSVLCLHSKDHVYPSAINVGAPTDSEVISLLKQVVQLLWIQVVVI